MGAWFHLWWQKVRKHRLLTIGIIVALIAFTLAVWMFGWDWTGFNGGYSQITTTSTSHGTTIATEKPPGKNLWDLLQLLIIPLVLAGGGLWFNQIQKDREQRAADERAETEREIALDNQRETALQEYLDSISELLLHEKLRESEAEDEVRKIARVRTLTVLPRLDPIRKGSVLQFLEESGLIDSGNPIIDLNRADLSRVQLYKPWLNEVDLHETNLSEADLYEADLLGANLSKADLYGAHLVGAILYAVNLKEAKLFGADLHRAELGEANLSGADLSEADLHRTSLREADLSGATMRAANLSEADLREANLQGTILNAADLRRAKLADADLGEATLFRADISSEQLEKAKSLKDAIMPNGSKHP